MSLTRRVLQATRIPHDGDDDASDYGTDDESLFTERTHLSEADSISSEELEELDDNEMQWLQEHRNDSLDQAAPGRAPLASHEDGGDEDKKEDDDSDNQDDDIDNAATASSSSNPRQKKRRRIGSVAHNFFESGKVVFISLDLETGGPRCGILQLSAELLDASGKRLGEPFDRYVRPPDSAVFLESACVHGIRSRNDPRIRSADGIEIVWPQFCQYVENLMPENHAGIIVAWNGQSCDMDWIYRLLHSHEYAKNNFKLPQRVDYFMDPMLVIKKHKDYCKLHPSNNPDIPNLKLETVYRHVTGHELANAHNSLADCQAQSVILWDSRFKNYWDKADSVMTVAEIWSKKTIKRLQRENEPYQPLHPSWKADGCAVNWDCPADLKYTSASGGARLGPTTAVVEICRTGGLAELCRFFLDDDLLKSIAKESNYYAHEEWVQQVPQRGGRSKYFRACRKGAPGACHRCTPKQDHKKFKFTSGYLLALFGIMMLHGARGSDRSPLIYWEEEPYGLRDRVTSRMYRKSENRANRKGLRFTETPTHDITSYCLVKLT